MKKGDLSSILRILALYVVFSGLWIAVSDRVLAALITDLQRLSLFQTYKGLVFIFASAVILFFLVRHEFIARGRAEADRRASEGKYRTLFETANDAIFVFDAETGMVLEANRKACEILGLPEEKIVGMRQVDLHPPEEAERCRGIFQEALEKGRLTIETACLSRRDGAAIPMEVSISVVEFGGRRIVLSIFRDIAERKEAERTLRQEKERAQSYLDVAGVIIVVINADGMVRLINRKGAEILGWSEGEITGSNWFDRFMPQHARERARAVFGKILSGGADPHEYLELPLLTRDGAERVIAWHNTVLKDERGRITGTLSSGEDITARKQAEASAQTRLQHLSVLHSLDLIISSSLDLRFTLKELLQFVTSQLGVDAADVLLLDQNTQTLEHAANQGFRTSDIEKVRLRLGEGIAGAAALEHKTISIPDILDPASGVTRTFLFAAEGFSAYIVVPLMAKGKVQGVLEVYHRTPLALGREQQGFLEALAAQAAIAIDNAALFDDLQRTNIDLMIAYDATLQGWARALDLRSRATERHTERVTEMTMRLAKAMGIDGRELVHIRRGALLHDVGKIGIPDSILTKPGPLTDQEWEIMRRHPQYAFDMLKPIAYLRSALDIPYAHHEHWDGTGYPRGLKGEQIPLAARIFAVADVWDAMIAEDRPYRRPTSEDEVRKQIRALAGTQLDPEIVELFLKMGW